MTFTRIKDVISHFQKIPAQKCQNGILQEFSFSMFFRKMRELAQKDVLEMF